MSRIARVARRIAAVGALSVVVVALLGGTPAFASTHSLPYEGAFQSRDPNGFIWADTRGNFLIEAYQCQNIFGTVYLCPVGHGYLHKTSTNHYTIYVCDDNPDNTGRLSNRELLTSSAPAAADTAPV